MESHKYEVLTDQDEEEIDEDALSKMTLQEQGSFYGKLGNSYESRLIEQLSSYKNLIDLKNNSLSADSIYRKIVGTIMNNNNLQVENLVKISATNTIPLLLSGGNPKTDIAITIEESNGTTLLETISIKKTTKNRVSCHDYSGCRFCSCFRLCKYEISRIFHAFSK